MLTWLQGIHVPTVILPISWPRGNVCWWGQCNECWKGTDYWPSKKSPKFYIFVYCACFPFPFLRTGETICLSCFDLLFGTSLLLTTAPFCSLLGCAYQSSEYSLFVVGGSAPSEVGFIICSTGGALGLMGGMVPGVLFQVCLECTYIAVQMASGLVDEVELWCIGGASWGKSKCFVSPLKIVVRACSALMCPNGCCAAKIVEAITVNYSICESLRCVWIV